MSNNVFLCTWFMGRGCNKSDCKNLHPDSHTTAKYEVDRKPEAGYKVCTFKCTLGDKCKFLHISGVVLFTGRRYPNVPTTTPFVVPVESQQQFFAQQSSSSFSVNNSNVIGRGGRGIVARGNSRGRGASRGRGRGGVTKGNLNKADKYDEIKDLLKTLGKIEYQINLYNKLGNGALKDAMTPTIKKLIDQKVIILSGISALNHAATLVLINISSDENVDENVEENVEENVDENAEENVEDFDEESDESSTAESKSDSTD